VVSPSHNDSVNRRTARSWWTDEQQELISAVEKNIHISGFRYWVHAGAVIAADTSTAPTGRRLRKNEGSTRLRLADRPRRVDQADVAEGLRKVADQLARLGIHFLREQADIVDEADRVLEGLPGSPDFAR